jgi:transcriptional regulator with XRE-family HTH domain
MKSYLNRFAIYDDRIWRVDGAGGFVSDGRRSLLKILENCSQQSVAKKIGCSQGTISKLASGKVLTDLDVAIGFQQHYGIPPTAWRPIANIPSGIASRVKAGLDPTDVAYPELPPAGDSRRGGAFAANDEEPMGTREERENEKFPHDVRSSFRG